MAKGKKKSKTSGLMASIILSLLTVGLLFCYAVQGRKFIKLSNEVLALEARQEELIEQNKKFVSDISTLSSTDRIEKIAINELGLHKATTQDIIRVEMNGGK